MLNTLWKLFRLKPYGNNLIDGMAELWLFLAALNIASIALCDAVAWSYFAWTTAHGYAAWISSIAAGLIVLTLVGSLDAMFIMHDRTKRRSVAPEEEPVRQGHIFQRLRRGIRRDHLAIAARIVLVILTFTVTAPFLTQLFFARDIAANIKRQNEQAVATKRHEVAARYDRALATTRAELISRQRDLEREIAGSGASGRYGVGPTAAAIARDVDQLQTELGETAAAKESELRTFDAASPEVLAGRYGIDVVREGPDTRARVIAEMEKSASFRATRRTIKAFLLFMFLGLVSLKLFQPESVRIYYSEHLQDAYTRMQAGLFDHRIDSREHPAAGGMKPLRFADWYENDQQVRDVNDRLRDQTSLAMETLKAQEDAIRVLQGTLVADLSRFQNDLAAASKTRDDLEQQIIACRDELTATNAKIAEEQQQLDDFRYDLADQLSLRDQQLLVNGRSRTARQLAEHRSAAARLSAQLATLTQRLDTTRMYEMQLKSSIASAESEATALSQALQNARRRRLADIVGG